MTARHLMKCGHVAQAYPKMPDGQPHPVCVICYGLTPKAQEVDGDPTELSGREATCICGARKPSSYSLPFFAHHPLMNADAFYDGCRGWS
jgi:hypothetical protein